MILNRRVYVNVCWFVCVCVCGGAVLLQFMWRKRNVNKKIQLYEKKKKYHRTAKHTILAQLRTVCAVR